MKKRILELTAVTIAALAFVPLFARPITVQAAAQDQKPSYTIPEYNAFQAANAEKDPAARSSCWTISFRSSPSSTLLQYVYQLYYQAYLQDEELPKGHRIRGQAGRRWAQGRPAVVLGALQTRVQAFSGHATEPAGAGCQRSAAKERDAALQGAKLLEAFPKPATPKCPTKISPSRRSRESRSSILRRALRLSR
jgi:hypothetical protein